MALVKMENIGPSVGRGLGGHRGSRVHAQLLVAAKFASEGTGNAGGGQCFNATAGTSSESRFAGESTGTGSESRCAGEPDGTSGEGGCAGKATRTSSENRSASK